MTNLPKEPPPGLLMSMAIRYDHALGCPGYYDWDHFTTTKYEGRHKNRLDMALAQMSQLYEEVAGYGFYKPERESEYVALSKL